VSQQFFTFTFPIRLTGKEGVCKSPIFGKGTENVEAGSNSLSNHKWINHLSKGQSPAKQHGNILYREQLESTTSGLSTMIRNLHAGILVENEQRHILFANRLLSGDQALRNKKDQIPALKKIP
jgi:hypothetical protein